jgi:hypothetical protein
MTSAQYSSVRELNIVALPMHRRNDVPDAAPRIQPVVQEAQLARLRRDGGEGKGGVDERSAIWSRCQSIT